MSLLPTHDALELVDEGYFDPTPFDQPDAWPELSDAQLLAEFGDGSDESFFNDPEEL